MLGVLAAMLMQGAAPASNGARPVTGYPERARAERVEGTATLSCEFGMDGDYKDCVVVAEEPPGWGFGATAVQLATLFHSTPSADGSGLKPGRVTIPFRFKLPWGFRPPKKNPGQGPLS
jgi:TonB family protein